MKVAVFDFHKFEIETFEKLRKTFQHQFEYFDFRLTAQTADAAQGFDVVCCFVNDKLNATTLDKLKELGVRLIALRSAGFNHVDLNAAKRLGLPVVRVPEYSPYAVAEHAIALILTLNRKIHRAYSRIRELNFSLDGLVGFDMHGKTVGVIGTGHIGEVMVQILHGFGCRVLAYDLHPNQSLVTKGWAEYTDLPTIYRQSDIISLHVPLTPETRHMINVQAIAQMKPNVLLINTGRGALIETQALIEALKTHRIGGAGLDVYEEEEGVFFHDLSEAGIMDDMLARLLSFPNVIITSHQAFLTQEALHNIVETTMKSIDEFAKGEPLTCQIQIN